MYKEDIRSIQRCTLLETLKVHVLTSSLYHRISHLLPTRNVRSSFHHEISDHPYSPAQSIRLTSIATGVLSAPHSTPHFIPPYKLTMLTRFACSGFPTAAAPHLARKPPLTLRPGKRATSRPSKVILSPLHHRHPNTSSFPLRRQERAYLLCAHSRSSSSLVGCGDLVVVFSPATGFPARKLNKLSTLQSPQFFMFQATRVRRPPERLIRIVISNYSQFRVRTTVHTS